MSEVRRVKNRVYRKARRFGRRVKEVRREYTGDLEGLQFVVTDPCGHVQEYFHTLYWHDDLAALACVERWLDTHGPC